MSRRLIFVCWAKGKHANILSSFSRIGSPTGFQSDRLTCLIVWLPAGWIVDSTLFEYGKPADVLRLKSVFSLTSYLLTLTYLLMVTHRLMSFAAHTDLQISLGICTDLELRSSFMLYSTQGYYF